MNLGERIKEARKAKGLSQSNVATDTLVSMQVISKMENGEPGFSKEKLQFVCDYLVVDTDLTEINGWHRKASGKQIKIKPITPVIKEVAKPVITPEVKPQPSQEDKINSPSHYQGNNGLEAIEVIKNFGTKEMQAGFYWGNAIKYMTRYRNKNKCEDLKKARKNLDWLIELEEN